MSTQGGMVTFLGGQRISCQIPMEGSIVMNMLEELTLVNIMAWLRNVLIAMSVWINKCDLIKLQSFCKAKDTVNRTKQQPTDWEKILTNPASDRGLIANVYKELKKLDFRKSNNPIKKWESDLNKEFSTAEYRIAKKDLKKCSTSLVSREMQIKTILRFYLTSVTMAKIKNSGNSRCW